MEKLLLLALVGTALGLTEPTSTSLPETSSEEVAELTVFEMKEPVQQKVETTTEGPSTPKADDIICAPYTPCKWVIFLHNAERDAWIKPMFQTRTRDLPNELYEKFMVHDEDVINKYCVCGPGTVCTRMENVAYSGYEVYRCRPGAA
ncbi:hypothetical protein EVAR_40118_1 [Eumeta japonica]|uniref:Uncharacterized protein n=1 Tax=Eumeta variegata TaxID=151549 RepID=A0A4C1WAM9_EUMVA|nr:hypothetical protein EVAR_40118_1 [Eumeta japonica]